MIKIIVIILTLLYSPPTLALSEKGETVRKSKNGVCHPQSSRYYEQLKHFKGYADMPSCLASGGRKAKKREGG